ncbi:MAG: AIR synthase-related protein, partial [Janthinobacterium lividum]
ADVEAFMAICRKWDVLATVVGEVTEDDRLVIDWHGETVVDVDPRTVALEGPVYHRPYARPSWQDEVQSNGSGSLERPSTGDELAETLLRLVASPNLCDKSWITDQFDRYVRGNSVLAQPEDAGMLRIDEETGLGVALATDCNGRFALLDPYAGAQLALAEAYRNVACSGAEPVAITDCLNFGSPEDPAIMWQFTQAIDGLVDGCRILKTPVTGGNVSFYNQTGTTPILPTPVVGVMGVIEDVTRRTPVGFAVEGDAVYLLGETRDELDGSAWADVVHDHLGGRPPQVDLAHEQRLADVLVRASRRGVLRSAHDLSDGGLAQALVESCLRRDRGVEVTLPEGADPFVALFSESAGRVLVSLSPDAEQDLLTLCSTAGVPLARLGSVTGSGDPTLAVADQFRLLLAKIRAGWEATIPAVLAS